MGIHEKLTRNSVYWIISLIGFPTWLTGIITTFHFKEFYTLEWKLVYACLVLTAFFLTFGKSDMIRKLDIPNSILYIFKTKIDAPQRKFDGAIFFMKFIISMAIYATVNFLGFGFLEANIWWLKLAQVIQITTGVIAVLVVFTNQLYKQSFIKKNNT